MLTGLRTNWPRDHPGAVALAAIELRTGARATAEWLTGTRIAVPVTRPIPDDPQPATTLARIDADLDAWLRLAPDEARREAVRHTLRRLVERFDLSSDPVVALLMPALEAGEPMTDGPDLDAVREAWRTAPNQYGVKLPMTEALRRDARSGVYWALTPSRYSYQPLDGLCQAKELIEDEWPSLRKELTDVARSAPTPNPNSGE